jgi:hypothetical protein
MDREKERSQLILHRRRKKENGAVEEGNGEKRRNYLVIFRGNGFWCNKLTWLVLIGGYET